MSVNYFSKAPDYWCLRKSWIHRYIPYLLFKHMYMFCIIIWTVMKIQRSSCSDFFMLLQNDHLRVWNNFKMILKPNVFALLSYLTLSFVMLQNSQTHFKKSCGVNTARFLKYIWPFYNIVKERLNLLPK